MKLREALTAFLAERPAQNAPDTPGAIHAGEATSDTPRHAPRQITQAIYTSSLELLASQLPNTELDDLTPTKLHDFLARWYVEEASAETLRAGDTSPDENLKATGGSARLPDAASLIRSLTDFFRWAESFVDTPINQQRSQVLDDLSESLPRAVEISVALSRYVAERGGAVAFPEFLTSFEAGGQSEYDIGGSAGEVGAMEGYFRILSVEGNTVAAEELIQEKHVSPIVLPDEIARLLDWDYILNLEIVRSRQGWQIVNCGFAYPPGTELY